MALKKINFDINCIVPKFRPVLSNKRKYKILKGGRGSGKTVFVPQFFILLYLNESDRNALFLRRYKTQARDSVYTSMRNVLEEWGLLNTVVKCNKTRMEFYFSNGNTIRCRGLDDPDGAKSSSFDHGYLTDLWFEEADQITSEALRTAVLTIRAKKPNVILTFNPVSRNSWIYKKFFTKRRKDVYINSSTYLDNPFLPEDYLNEMLQILEDDPELYRVICLGEWGNLKDIIYFNLVEEEIPLNDDYYDHIFYGQDFGFNDPMAWVKVGVKDKEFYILDEIYKNQIDIQQLVELYKEHNVPKNRDIECDTDIERRLQLIKAGYRAVTADKTGSKTDRIKMIHRKKIHVHPRCSKFLWEASIYKWKPNRLTGESSDQPNEFFDHLMDAFSYAVIRYLKSIELGKSNTIGVNKKRIPTTRGKNSRNSRGR